MGLPSPDEWVTVRDGRPVPYRDVVRQGVLVPIAPDGERPRVRGVGMFFHVEALSRLPPPWLAPSDDGPPARAPHPSPALR